MAGFDEALARAEERSGQMSGTDYLLLDALRELGKVVTEQDEPERDERGRFVSADEEDEGRDEEEES